MKIALVDVEDAHQRVLALQDMGITPFAQPYRDHGGGEPPENQHRSTRWINNKAAFNSCAWEDNCGTRRKENGR